MKKQIVKVIQTYEEPEIDENGNLIKKTTAGQDKEDDLGSEEDVRLEMDLAEGTLKVNLGIPVIVVVNKADILMQ